MIVRWIRLAIASALVAGTVGAHAQAPYRITYDDFKDGFSPAKWFFFQAGPFIGNDGIASTSNKGLYVRAPGTNPITGEPMFTLTVGQESDPVDNPFGLPGGFDHVKWLAYATHTASSFYPGYDAVPGQELIFDTWIGGRSYGNDLHPFGAAVTDPDDDVRLPAPAMNTIDLETFLVADFFLTNKRIYALYERLPFGRGQGTNGANYAAFTYAVPVGTRKPHQMHHLAIAYDRSAGTMRWLIDDKEVFRVNQLGHRLPSRQYLLIDHGGINETVVCRQRDIGFGTFTLLDGGFPGQQALVSLSNAPGFYYSTSLGEPTPQSFLDILSVRGSRLWGAGADLRVKKVVVSSR